MPEVSFICDRCGGACVEASSRVEATGGPLTARLAAPVTLCSDCTAMFADFLGPRGLRPKDPRKAVVDPRGFQTR